MNSYDDVPYPSHAFPATAPGRLAVVGALLGLDPPDPRAARVLELGCSSGGNLLAHASVWPDSRCLGLDLSPRQVALGRRVAADLGVDNVTLEVADLLTWRPEPGAWDYVICHGVYAWVPTEVQAAILRIAREALSPHGVAVVSWNANPGWQVQGAVRDAMRLLVDADAPLAHRAARAQDVLRVLAGSAADSPHGRTLARVAAQLELLPDSYVAHEYLEAHNEPRFIAEFAREAAAAGLRYLCDSHLAGGLLGAQDDAARRWLGDAPRPQVEVEQYLDFLHCRPFHTSLLVRPEAPVQRDLAAADLSRFHLTAAAAPEDAAEDPVVDALRRVARTWPASVPFEELAAGVPDRRALAKRVLHGWLAGEISLSRAPRPRVGPLGPRPVGWRVARYQAGRGHMVGNLWHDTVALAPLDLWLLRQLDGTRSVADLAERVRPLWERMEGAGDDPEALVVEHLGQLAASGLIVG